MTGDTPSGAHIKPPGKGSSGTKGASGGAKASSKPRTPRMNTRNSSDQTYVSGNSENFFGILGEENEDEAECIACNKTFKGDEHPMISCSRCKSWKCMICAGLTPETYAFVTQREDFAWFCPPCKAPAAEDVLNGVLIEEKCKKFFETYSSRLDSIESTLALKADTAVVTAVSTKVSTVEQTILGLAGDISKINSKFQLLRTEQAEVAKRTKNIVIRGVKESVTVDDIDIVKEIFKDINCTDFEIEHLTRLGRIELQQTNEDGGARAKARPIRVTLKNQDDKKHVIKNAATIRHSTSTSFNPKLIFIIPDQTKLEREHDIELRKNLRAARERDPDGRYSIRSGRIVKLDNQPQLM